MANNGKDDKELDDYLKGNSDISNHYRASNTGESPAHLDEIILSAAKDAVTESKQKSNVVFHKSPWALPVSIAAVITLSVSLVVTMQQETGQPLISEPESIMDDSETLLEEAVMPQTMSADDGMFVLDETEVKQSNDERTDDAPAASGAVGGYRAESNDKASTKDAALQPAKKALIKQKARSEISEESVFAKEQVLQSAPAAAVELDAVMELKRERQLGPQDQELMNIKALWEEGDLTNAKQAYEDFIKKYPAFTEEKIKEILGPYVYQNLINM